MLLLHIDKNKIGKNNLLQISHLKNLVNRLNYKITFLKRLKTIKNLRVLMERKKKSESLSFKSEDLTRYIVGISIYNKNIVLFLSDVKGKIKFFRTAGSLNVTRKQKKKKITVLIKLLKELVLKNRNKNKIGLHLKNFNQKLSFFIVAFLKKYYDIETIKINNNKPHNGCRPKKIKRKKRRKLNFNKR